MLRDLDEVEQAARGIRPRVLLLMNEYLGLDHLPLWWRQSTEDVGLASGVEKQLSQALVDEMHAWNCVWELPTEGGGFPSPEAELAHQVLAFNLSAHLQNELGDSFHVWCGGGEGIDAPEPRREQSIAVLKVNQPGSRVTCLYRDQRSHLISGPLRVSTETSRAIIRWRQLTERIGRPFGDASTRGLGLEAAALIQRDAGLTVRVRFFAGVDSQIDYEHFRG